MSTLMKLYNSIINMALDDFCILLETYMITNSQVLERVTDRMIHLSHDSYKQQLVISQSIILESMVARRIGAKRIVTFNV